MSNEKVPPGTGIPLINNAYTAPYPPAAMGGNNPVPPPYTVGAQTFPAGGPQAFPPGGPQAYSPGGPQAFPPGGPQAFPAGGPQAFPAGGPQAFPAGGPQATVFMAAPVQATVVVGAQLSDTPAVTVCPTCRQSITTRVEYSTGLLTWLVFGILCLFVCWLGCCFIPFCVNSCKDVDHFCPSCNHHIYKYKRM